MNPNDRTTIPLELLEAYSRAELSRRELGERLGNPVSFGRLLAALQQVGLRLPRFASDPASPGAVLVKQLTERAMARGG